MPNRGVAPLDPNTEVGRLRALLRDTSFNALTPTEPGFGDYAVFSDDQLSAYLLESSDNVKRAAGLATRALALEYSAKGKSIKTDDLSIDLRMRGKDLLAVAESFLEDAAADEAAEVADLFTIVPFPGNRDPRPVRPEATPWPLVW